MKVVALIYIIMAFVCYAIEKTEAAIFWILVAIAFMLWNFIYSKREK